MNLNFSIIFFSSDYTIVECQFAHILKVVLLEFKCFRMKVLMLNVQKKRYPIILRLSDNQLEPLSIQCIYTMINENIFSDTKKKLNGKRSKHYLQSRTVEAGVEGALASK